MNPTEIKATLEKLNQARLDVLKHQGPESMKAETSYLDADSIHGNHRRAAVDVFEEYQQITSQMDDLRNELRNCVESFDTLAHKVLFLVDVYGMTQKEAAEYLGYSYGYIRNLFAKM